MYYGPVFEILRWESVPSSSHTVGPMKAARRLGKIWNSKVPKTAVKVDLYVHGWS